MNAVFYMSQLAGKTMLAKYGKIINIASMTAFFASVLIPAYSASKGGVAQITKGTVNEWASQGVNVNTELHRGIWARANCQYKGSKSKAI